MDSSQNSNDRYAREDWQKYYAEDDLRWDLVQGAPPLVRLWDKKKLGQGKVIIPGCGDVVDEAALKMNLVNGTIAGAALDVFPRNLWGF